MDPGNTRVQVCIFGQGKLGQTSSDANALTEVCSYTSKCINKVLNVCLSLLIMANIGPLT